MIPAILQPLGAMTGLLAIWLLLHNEFAPWLFPAAILMSWIGVVME